MLEVDFKPNLTPQNGPYL